MSKKKKKARTLSPSELWKAQVKADSRNQPNYEEAKNFKAFRKYYHYSIGQFVSLVESEMRIKNHLFEFIAHKGLTEEYFYTDWYSEYIKD